MVKVGDAVIFVDSYGKEHFALLTNVFRMSESYFQEELVKADEIKAAQLRDWQDNPTVNLVLVSSDESKTDGYGRQLERHTSLIHKNRQFANGMFWKRIDE